MPPYFTDGLTVLGLSIEHPVCVVLWSTTRKFRYHLRRAQLGGHVAQFVPCFNQLGFTPRLNVYCSVRDTI